MFAASIQMSIEKYFVKKARIEDEDQPEPEVSV